MKKTCINFAMVAFIALCTSGCVTNERSMREPSSRVDFTKNDFNFSDQVTGEGKDTKVFGIDFFRIGHSSDMGMTQTQGGRFTVEAIPIIGKYLADESAYYALYDLMEKNPGYDVIFYPQYTKRVKRPILGIGFIYKKTTVKVTARLGKIK